MSYSTIILAVVSEKPLQKSKRFCSTYRLLRPVKQPRLAKQALWSCPFQYPHQAHARGEDGMKDAAFVLGLLRLYFFWLKKAEATGLTYLYHFSWMERIPLVRRVRKKQPSKPQGSSFDVLFLVSKCFLVIYWGHSSPSLRLFWYFFLDVFFPPYSRLTWSC